MIQTADALVEAQKKQVEIRDLRLVESEKQIGSLTKEVTDLKISQDRWFKSPYLWVVVGIVTGALITRKF